MQRLLDIKPTGFFTKPPLPFLVSMCVAIQNLQMWPWTTSTVRWSSNCCMQHWLAPRTAHRNSKLAEHAPAGIDDVGLKQAQELKKQLRKSLTMPVQELGGLASATSAHMQTPPPRQPNTPYFYVCVLKRVYRPAGGSPRR